MTIEAFPALTWIRNAFDTDGYVIVRDVLDDGLVAEMGRHINFLTKRNPGVRPEYSE